MSEPEGALQVVIWTPEGVPSRHWVHRCQFFEGDFVLRQTPPVKVRGAIGSSGRGSEIREAVE